MNRRPDDEQNEDRAEPDVLDEEAAQIDPRSDEAPDQIEELIELAEEQGREPDQEVTTDPGAAP